LYAAYFHTGDYDTRLNTYEKNLPYAYTATQLYGKGRHLSATLRWDASKHLFLSAKLSCTRYAGRDTTGTGPEEADGNTKADISALLRWKF
jgi:hypothetical protein